MLLLGVADCCWIVHLFAFIASSVLLISITFAGSCIFQTANKRQPFFTYARTIRVLPFLLFSRLEDAYIQIIADAEAPIHQSINEGFNFRDKPPMFGLD